jgi:hypothetical protein
VHGMNPLSVDNSTYGATLDAELKCLHGKGLGVSSKQAEPLTLD